MPQFTVGQDCQVAIDGPFGTIQMPLGTKFVFQQGNSTPMVKALTGSREARVIFDSWTIGLTFARADSTLDDLAQSIQTSSLAGTPVPYGTITYAIREQDGSTSTWQFTGVTFNPKDLGDFEADKAVTQTLDCMAQKRDQV